MKDQIIESLPVEKIDPYAIERELCKRSLYYFVKEFWETVPGYKKYKDNWHVKYICDELQEAGMRLVREEKKQGDIYISIPPGLGKSFITILFKCWLYSIKPSLQIICASYSQGLSTKDLSFKTREVLKSDKYKLLFPYVSLKDDKMAVGDFYTNHNGSHFSTSPESAVTGKRYELLTLDDPLNIDQAYSEKDRAKTNEWVDELWSRKLDAEYSLMIVVQQRLHVSDTIGHLLAKGGNFKYICLPAEYNRSLTPSTLKHFYDEREGLLFPDRLSREALDDAKRNSARAYASQYLQSPMDDANSVLKENSFPIISKQDFIDLMNNRPITVDFFCDLAYTSNRKRNDPSVILAATKIGELIYILNLWRDWKEFNTLIEQIKYFTQANGYSQRSRIFIEPQGPGQSAFQTLRQETGLNLYKTPSYNGVGKFERLNLITPKVESQRVILLRDKWNRLFLDEVCGFSAHDDIKDCLCMAVDQMLTRKLGRGQYHYQFI